MSQDDSLHQFGAYRKAGELFDLAVTDMTPPSHNPLCTRLVSQQIASADPVSSNIEEGCGRRSRADYARFLVSARGSAAEIITARVALCDEIIAILSATIRTLRPEP